MVHSDIAVGFFIIFKEWKFCNPKEIEFIFRNNVKLFSYMKSQSAKYRQSNLVFIGNDKSSIAFFTADFCKNSIQFFFTEKFSKGA